MPGPKMGPRPADFDEDLVRKAPTFQKWLQLVPGERLTYACRQFVKGGVEDEERLMRRIMIARRNNLKDHKVLKMARATEADKRGVIPEEPLKRKGARPKVELEVEEGFVNGGDNIEPVCPPSPSNPSGTKRRRVAGSLQTTEEEILMEMDVPAVESTRSYRRWLALPDGASFRYNQTYFKGKEDHDWLLKKNIWRRMRYRRENRIKVAGMKIENGEGVWTSFQPNDLNDAINARAAAEAAIAGEEQRHGGFVSRTVMDAAAIAAAQVEAFQPGDIDADAVAALGPQNDPIVTSALDAAAQLAAAAVADTIVEGQLDVLEPPSLEPPAGALPELGDVAVGDEGVESVNVTIAI